MSDDNSQKITEEALNDNPSAQFELGQLYEFGKGMAQDYAEAMKWYQKAATSNHATDNAIIAKAQYSIALLYEQGRGVEIDYEKAAEYYQQAAQKGDAWAMNNLAYLYSHGRGVEQNDDLAQQWYHRAAQLGHFQSQYNLAARYAAGRGVDVDLVSAYFWFERSKMTATALNTERANKMQEIIKEHMTEEQIQEAQDRYNQLFTPID